MTTLHTPDQEPSDALLSATQHYAQSFLDSLPELPTSRPDVPLPAPELLEAIQSEVY